MLDLKFQRFGKCTLKADHKAPTHIEFSPNYLDLVVELADLQLIARSNWKIAITNLPLTFFKKFFFKFSVDLNDKVDTSVDIAV
jgi:hypothetical protein